MGPTAESRRRFQNTDIHSGADLSGNNVSGQRHVFSVIRLKAHKTDDKKELKGQPVVNITLLSLVIVCCLLWDVRFNSDGLSEELRETRIR